MCPALCYALRLALLSHNVSLRFQSIMVPSFSVYFRTNVHNKVTYRSSGAELFPYTFVKFSIIKCHSLHQLTSQRHWQHSCWNMSLFRLDGVCASKFHWEECAIYIIYLPSACSRVAFFMLSLSACPSQTACSNAAGTTLAGGGGHRYAYITSGQHVLAIARAIIRIWQQRWWANALCWVCAGHSKMR